MLVIAIADLTVRVQSRIHSAHWSLLHIIHTLSLKYPLVLAAFYNASLQNCRI